MATATNMAMPTNGDNSLRAFDGGDNGDGAKDKVARATTGERGMMVAMGHGLCMLCFYVFMYDTGFSQNVLAVQKWIHSGYIYN